VNSQIGTPDPKSYFATLKIILWAVALFALLWVMIDTNRFHAAPSRAQVTSTVSTSGPAVSTGSG
jgi:hypothetical protein